jgi:MFS family permease
VGSSVREAIRTRRFIGLYIACLICAFGLFVPFVHVVPYALDHGMSQSHALWLLPAIGVGSTAGRFLLGNWADRIGRRRGLIVMFAGIAIAFAIWALATTVWTLVFFAVVFGLFYGGFVALVPALVMDYFGGRNISGIIGILYTSVAVGTLVGPSLAGYVFDVRHSYALAIAVSACTNVVAAAIVALSSREPVRSTVRAAARTSIRPQDRVARRVRRRELAR